MRTGAYYELANEKNPARIEANRNKFWEYCKLGSLAMVGIMEKLDGI